jgi:hypothetical protein
MVMHLNPSTKNNVGHIYQGDNHYCYPSAVISNYGHMQQSERTNKGYNLWGSSTTTNIFLV